MFGILLKYYPASLASWRVSHQKLVLGMPDSSHQNTRPTFQNRVTLARCLWQEQGSRLRVKIGYETAAVAQVKPPCIAHNDLTSNHRIYLK